MTEPTLSPMPGSNCPSGAPSSWTALARSMTAGAALCALALATPAQTRTSADGPATGPWPTKAALLSAARAGEFTADAPLIVRTEFGDRALAGTFGAGDDALRTSLGARDPLLDQMAFSKGRFAVEVAGRTPLYLPSWPEVTRVIEDCR